MRMPDASAPEIAPACRAATRMPAAAAVVAWALHQATALAFEGLAFSLPWPYVGAAVGMVLAVLALSVAYALARARAGSVVEALRADAI